MENKGKTLTASTLALLLTEIGAIGESYIGTCNTGMTPSTTVIVSSDLRGYDDDHFNKGWELFVVHKDTVPGTLPQGERRDITDYVSSTGAFTTDAFSANVSEDDEIIVARLTSFPFDSMIMGVDPVSGSIASFLSSGPGSTVLGTRLGIDSSIIDALGHNGMISLGSGVYGNIGDFSAQTNITTLLAALGIPDVAAKPLYTCLVTDRLDNVTFGLGALNNDLDALLLDMGDFSSQTNLLTLLAALGIPDVAAKPLYTCLVTDRLDNVTFGLGALNNDLDALLLDMGDFSAQTNLQTLLAALGIPDVAAKPLYTCLVTDRLDNAGFGLSAIVNTYLADATIGLSNIKTLIDGIKAKTDLLNSASGASTLNDANTSDTIIPGSLPTNIHLTFDISNIVVAADDFIIEIKIGVAASERVVGYYNITSDGTNTTIDKGSGTGAVVKQRRIDISDILVYTGEQVLVEYTKNSVTDRNVPYNYVCGV